MLKAFAFLKFFYFSTHFMASFASQFRADLIVGGVAPGMPMPIDVC